VIVTNTTHELCPWADFLFAMDSAWWRLNIAAVLLTFRGERVTRHRRIEDVSYVEFSKPRHSGDGAIRLAAHYGATKIILIGYDCQHTGGKKHWHGDHPRGLGNANTVGNWVQHYQQLAAEIAGVEIINATRETALNQWPKMALEDALQ